MLSSKSPDTMVPTPRNARDVRKVRSRQYIRRAWVRARMFEIEVSSTFYLTKLKEPRNIINKKQPIGISALELRNYLKFTELRKFKSEVVKKERKYYFPKSQVYEMIVKQVCILRYTYHNDNPLERCDNILKLLLQPDLDEEPQLDGVGILCSIE